MPAVRKYCCFMEELVYIVLIVVWLLVSFLKRKPGKGSQAGKQQPSAQGEEAAPSEEMDMEDMLEEFFGGGKKKKEKEDQPAREPVYETKERSYRQGKDESFRGEETVWERESADREGESPGWEQYESRDKSQRKDYEDYEGATAKAQRIEDEATSVDKVQTIEELIRSHKKEEAMRQAREEEDNAGDSQSEGVPDFDLRQAVIFSEILNRKYN